MAGAERDQAFSWARKLSRPGDAGRSGADSIAHEMIHGISVSFSPIGGSWPLVVVAIASVLALTLWAYSRRLKGTGGRWR